VKRIILCSGKVYYDLLKYRSERKIDDAALIRIEQLYPLAEKRLREMLKPFPKGAKLVWCQEEPQNMGAGLSSNRDLRTLFCTEIAYAGREPVPAPRSARSPATTRASASRCRRVFDVTLTVVAIA
jgi:2-oxoglutarate dehydrogenase complex, dehydrogenase (E1) component, and related enzymes